MSTNPERWLPVVGFEGYYEVSDQGRVRRVARLISDRLGRQWTTPARVLAQPRRGNPGYASVSLSKSGKTTQIYVHHLVLDAFDKPRPAGMVSRHLNGDRNDNRAVNLAWGTQQENIADKFRHGTDHNTNKTHCKWGHEFSVENTRWVGNHRYCRACVIRNREQRASRLTEIDDPRHGTLNGYFNYSCRCGLCKAAQKQYERNRKESA